MIGKLIRLAVIVAILVVGYNYFFGSASEREQSREIVNRGVELGKDLWGSLRGAINKVRHGEYDGVTERLEGVIGELKQESRQMDNPDVARRLNELEARRDALESDLRRSESAAEDEALKRRIDELVADTEALMYEMETKAEQ